MRSDPTEVSLADYEERYSLTGSLVLVIIGCLILVVGVVWGFVVGLAQQTEPLGDLVSYPGFWGFVATTVLAVAMFGGYCVGWLVAAMTGQVAMRVDRHGVLFGRVPSRRGDRCSCRGAPSTRSWLSSEAAACTAH